MDLAVGEDGAVVAFEDVLDGLCCTMTVDVGLVAAAIPAVVERKVIRPAALRLELDVFGAEVEPQPLVGPEADLTLVERPEAAENLATARD